VHNLLFQTPLLMRYQANIPELFKTVFHLTKDQEYIMYDGASREAIASFLGGTGPGPDPLALQWDMAITHKLDWNQQVIGMLLSLYISMEEKNHWIARSHQSITNDITLKFSQCNQCGRKAQPLICNNGTRKSMPEVGDRLVEKMNERLWLARVLTRRTTVSHFLVSSLVK
jgi:hypothetical protein